MANYHPLTILSYAIEYHFVQLNPKLYHVTNIIIHLLNTVLVFWFILLLSKKNNVAFITALLFGIHPMHVESVAWISERKDVLYAFFYLGAMIAYIKSFTPDYSLNRSKIFNFLFGQTRGAVFFLFFLSLLSKPMAVMLPFCLLLIDYFFNRKISFALIGEKKFFFMISIIFGMITLWSQQEANAVHENNQFFAFADRFFFPFYVWMEYLRKIIWPLDLSALYPFPIKANGLLPVMYYCSLLIISLIFFLIYQYATRKQAIQRVDKNINIAEDISGVIVFGSLFFLINLLMVSQIIPFGSAIVADRYTYVSYIGIFFIIGFGVNYLIINLPNWKNLIWNLFAIISLCLCVLTFQRCKIWKNDPSLWEDAMSKYPNEIGYANLGLYYKSNGLYEDAMRNYNEAIKYNVGYNVAYENRGNIYFAKGQFDLALSDYERALSINPNSAIALNSKGAVLFNYNQYDSAFFYFNKAIENDYSILDAFKNRGNVLSVMGRYDLALSDYNKYLKTKPEALVYNWRGIANMNLGRTNEALSDFNKAKELGLKIP